MNLDHSIWLVIVLQASLPALFCLSFYRGSLRCCGSLSEARFFEPTTESPAPLFAAFVIALTVLSVL